MTWLVLGWTPSGSCPLCLTPPCYQLQKPPETAALFFAAFLTALPCPVIPGHARSLSSGRALRGPVGVDPESRVVRGAGFRVRAEGAPRNDEKLETIISLA